jgi:hypothetical protein
MMVSASMMTVEELLSSAPRRPSRMPEMDPLREADALREAQLLDLRMSALRSTAGLLFEFRTSLQFDEGNAALVIVRDLRDLRWCRERKFSPLTALTVISSLATVGDTGAFGIELEFFPDASLEVRGGEAEFYVLEVPGIGEAPPDYVESPFEVIGNRLPSWTSVCSVLQASRLPSSKPATEFRS